MKYVKQVMVILFISLMGEMLASFLPLPIPASIYGMAILFIGLLTGIVRIEWVKETGLFLIEIMPIFFIPVCVGLLDAWADIQAFWIPISIAVLIITIIVMIATGKSAQYMIRHGKLGGEI